MRKNVHVMIIATALLLFSSCKKSDVEPAESSVKEAELTVSTISQSEAAVLNDINAKIISMETKEDVIKAINFVTQLVESPANKDMKIVQIYGHLLWVVPALNGIFYRLRTVVAPCRTCHVNVLNTLKNIYLKNYLTGKHVRAFVDYLVEGVPVRKLGDGKLVTQGGVLGPEFESFSDYQENMLLPFIRRTNLAVAKIDEIVNGRYSKGGKVIVAGLPDTFQFNFDNRVLSGGDDTFRFISNSRRFKVVGKGALNLLLAQKYRILAIANYMYAYNMDETFRFLGRLATSIGLHNIADKFKPWESPSPWNATPYDVVNILKEKNGHSFESLFTLRSVEDQRKNAVAHLKDSFVSLQNAIRTRHSGVKQVMHHGTQTKNEKFLIRPDAMKATLTSEFSPEDQDIAKEQGTLLKNLALRLKIYEDSLSVFDETVAEFNKTGKVSRQGATQLTSLATGGVFRVNPAAFFVGHADLKKVFLPSGYKKTGSSSERKKVGGKFYDFDYGAPNKWVDPTFGGLFPENSNHGDVVETLRHAKLTPATRRLALVLPFL